MHLKPLDGEFAAEQIHNSPQQLVQIDRDGVCRVSIEAQGLLRDLRHARQFVVGCLQAGAATERGRAGSVFAR